MELEGGFPCVEEGGAIPSMTSYKITCRQDRIDSTAVSASKVYFLTTLHPSTIWGFSLHLSYVGSPNAGT